MTNNQSKNKRKPAGALKSFIGLYYEEGSNNLLDAGLAHTKYQWKDIETAFEYGYIFFANKFTLNYYPQYLESIRGTDLQLWNLGTFLMYALSYHRYLTNEELTKLSVIHEDKGYKKKFYKPYYYYTRDLYPVKGFILHVNEYRDKAKTMGINLHHINHLIKHGEYVTDSYNISHLSHLPNNAINGEDTYKELYNYNNSRTPCDAFEIYTYPKNKSIIFLFNYKHLPLCKWLGKNSKGLIINNNNREEYNINNLKEDIKLFNNFIYLKETNSYKFVNKIKLIYENGLKKNKEWKLLILLDDNNNYLLILTTINSIKIFKKLLNLFKIEEWNGKINVANWKKYEFEKDLLEDIDTTLKWPLKYDIDDLDMNLVSEKSTELIEQRKKNRCRKGAGQKRKRQDI